MDAERNFEDLGVDAIVGTELMLKLGVSNMDLIDPARFMRFQDVVKYLKDVPQRDFIINKITASKMVDKLDHVWGYVQLLNQRSQLEKSIQDKNEELDKIRFVEGLETSIAEYQTSIEESMSQLNLTIDQMASYEK